nr:ABC transporter ATP-binding protein [Treponema putidum]
MSKTVIQVEELSKHYRLGVINNGSLFRDIQSWWALKRGKENPHSRIGEEKYLGSDTNFWALKDLTFNIHQGDRVGIIGKNGAGKSTLLKVLSRITAPTKGLIKIRGKISSLLEVGTGFHGELTGRENIYLNGAILGMKKMEIDGKLDEIIDFSGIEKHIDTPVKRYSSGMYVRLAFAVAANLDSDILIADEVLAVGDAEFQNKAIGKMSDLSSSQGRTVLFVSHNMTAVKRLCNRGMILENGMLKFESDSIDKAIDAYFLKGNFSNQVTYAADEQYAPNSVLKVARIYPKNNNLVLEAEYDTEILTVPYLGFVFYDKNNYPIFGINPRNFNMMKNKEIKKGLIRIEIQQPQLADGIYRISLWLGHKIDDLGFYEHFLQVFVNNAIKSAYPINPSISGAVLPKITYCYN